EVAHGAHDRPATGARAARADFSEACEQRLDLFLALSEMRLAGIGDRVELLCAFRLLLLDQPHILEHGERRIDDAGARGIGAAGALLDVADQVIAVARLLLDQLEQDEPELAAVEHAAAATAMMAVAGKPPFDGEG